MERKFSAYEIAAAILADLQNVDGSQKYLEVTYGAQALVDAFGMPAQGAPAKGKGVKHDGDQLRAELSVSVSGNADCVQTYFNAVRAYEERTDKPLRERIQRDEVLQMAHMIIGGERTVDIPEPSEA